MSAEAGDRAWLASCSLAPRTAEVRAALLATDVTAAAPDAWDQFERAAAELRAALAAELGASPDQVALLPSASVAAYQALGSAYGPRPVRTLTSRAEFPSLAHVWARHREVHGGTVRFADDGTDAARTGDVGATYLEALAQPDPVDLVSVPLVAYDTGERLPVEDVATAARAAGAVTLVDAYQHVGTGPLDVRALGCDFLVGGTSKYLLGLPGLAFLYVRDPAGLPHAPMLTGWWGRCDPLAFDHRRVDFPRTARRVETGTLPVPSVAAALAGLRVLTRVPAAERAAHRDRLTTTAWDLLDDLGRRPVTPRDPARRGAHVAVPSHDARREARELAAHGVVCAPRGDLLRLAFHVTNDSHDLDRLSAALTRRPLHRSTVDKGALTR